MGFAHAHEHALALGGAALLLLLVVAAAYWWFHRSAVPGPYFTLLAQSCQKLGVTTGSGVVLGRDWPWSGHAQFAMAPVGRPGYFALRERHTGWALGAMGYSENAPLMLTPRPAYWLWGQDGNQLILQPVAAASQISGDATGHWLAMNVANGSCKSGAGVHLWGADGGNGANQWVLNPVA